MDNQVRIIGGRWRGRQVPVLDSQSLRPTPDRVRETLFNWLGLEIQNAHCLDLFAGSGILGLEALSRGASQVTFIDQDPATTQLLEKTILSLPPAQKPQLFIQHRRYVIPNLIEKESPHNSCVHLLTQDALLPIAQASGPYDIIFLDPPFKKDLLNPCIPLLKTYGYEKPGTFVYLEMERGFTPLFPEHWKLYRESKAGKVVYQLVEVQA